MRLRTPDAQARSGLADSSQRRSRDRRREHAQFWKGSTLTIPWRTYRDSFAGEPKGREEERDRKGERGRERAREREREKKPRVKERGENWTHQTLVARNLTCVQRSTVPPSARPVHLASPLQRLSPTGSTSTRSLFLRLLAPATTQYRVLWRIPAICLGISRVFAIF